MNEIETLGDVFPKEIERCKKLLPVYEALGYVGKFGHFWISDTVQKAEKAWAEMDTVAMVQLYPKLRDCQ